MFFNYSNVVQTFRVLLKDHMKPLVNFIIILAHEKYSTQSHVKRLGVPTPTQMSFCQNDQ